MVYGEKNYKTCIITVRWILEILTQINQQLKKKQTLLQLHNSNTGGISQSFTITPSNTAAVNCLQSVYAICFSPKFIFTCYNAKEYPVMPRTNSEIISIKHGHRKRKGEGKKLWFGFHLVLLFMQILNLPEREATVKDMLM